MVTILISTRNVALIDLAKQNHVTIICLPPHSTHKMQPLDVAFIAPLKTYYAKEIENWLRENQLSVVSPHAVASIFCKAYNKAISHHIFRDFEFGIQEHLQTQNERDEQIIKPNHEQPHHPMREHRTPSPPLPHQQLVSPKDICPIPTYKRYTTKKPHARSGKASVITLTPYKEELEQSLQKKKAKKLVPQLNLNCVLAPEKNSSTKSVRSEKKATPEEEIAVHEDVGQPATSKGKTSRRKRKVSSSSSSDSSEDFPLADSSSDESREIDAECLFCTGKFSDDRYGERWTKCYQCGRWAHEDCGEIKSSTFICLFCEGKVFFE
ncbi:uncharacterized protein LOC126885873 [Diabrotica virgifera virgifera]|uniref:DDE-1 domain-containing protein n=1 Tax=Diabrotica virgifera virgifera TaxID=50390 RepID=A0ABM5KEJ6_DIAVI|nr:uncharacterized protein LOC126885873 [Diabrotica virgifera virgifera]